MKVSDLKPLRGKQITELCAIAAEKLARKAIGTEVKFVYKRSFYYARRTIFRVIVTEAKTGLVYCRWD